MYLSTLSFLITPRGSPQARSRALCWKAGVLGEEGLFPHVCFLLCGLSGMQDLTSGRLPPFARPLLSACLLRFLALAPAARPVSVSQSFPVMLLAPEPSNSAKTTYCNTIHYSLLTCVILSTIVQSSWTGRVWKHWKCWNLEHKEVNEKSQVTQ